MRCINKLVRPLSILVCCIAFLPICLFSQADNEIQVYASAITPQRVTLFELHQNHTFNGPDGLTPAKSAHWTFETLEITRGLGKNFEIGFYTFTGFSPSGGYQYLGNHIRPRFTFPESWKLPFGASISLELGYIRSDAASGYHFDGELRPIADKSVDNFYFSINLNIAFASDNKKMNFEFGPQCKIVYTVQKKFGLGLEYYTSLGSFKMFSPFKQQEHLLGPMVDLYSSSKWELQGGLLFGLTPGSNKQVIKLIVGRRLSGK